jgi:hypothetical protein
MALLAVAFTATTAERPSNEENAEQGGCTPEATIKLDSARKLAKMGKTNAAIDLLN